MGFGLVCVFLVFFVFCLFVRLLACLLLLEHAAGGFFLVFFFFRITVELSEFFVLTRKNS